jgi:hypothetical protein
MNVRCLSVLSLLAAFCFLPGCAKVKDIAYDTEADQPQLQALKGKRIAIVAPRYNPGAFSGKPIADSVVSPLLANHVSLLRKALGPLFTLVDDPAASGRPLDPAKPESLSAAMKDAALDGALFVTCSYGFIDLNGTQLWFASNTRLVDRDGRAVWRFYGKAWALQGVAKSLSAGEIMRNVVGAEALPAAFPEQMATISDAYVSYLGWVLERDLKGEAGRNYFVDYPSDRRNKNIGIYPAAYNTNPAVADAASR